MAGESYVSYWYLCHVTDLLIFYKHGPEVFIQRIWVKLSSVHIAAGKIGGGYIDDEIAMAVAQLALKHRED